MIMNRDVGLVLNSAWEPVFRLTAFGLGADWLNLGAWVFGLLEGFSYGRKLLTVGFTQWVVCLSLVWRWWPVTIESLTDYNKTPLTRLIICEMFLNAIHWESLDSYSTKECLCPFWSLLIRFFIFFYAYFLVRSKGYSWKMSSLTYPCWCGIYYLKDL